jgi:hypothetical protein
MPNRRQFMQAVASTIPLVASSAFADDAVLDHATITFTLPKGDDKDDDTVVSVSVTSRLNNQFNATIAGKSNFAGTDHWEDGSGKSYTYALDVITPIRFGQLTGAITTRIHIQPNGKDTVKFGYHLELVFSDGNKVQQDRDGIVLDQNNRDFVS